MKIYTVEEVAEILRTTERHVYRLLNDKELAGFKLGNLWRVKEADLLELMEGKNESQN